MSWVAFIRSLSLPLQWWVTVAPWEQALRVRKGKTAKMLGAGLHWKVPFLDRVHIVATRKRMVSERGLTVTTRDGHVVTLNIAIQFAVADALQLFEAIANPEITIIQRVSSAIAEHVAATPWSNLSLETVRLSANTSVPALEWGLSDVDVCVTTFARVRTYRLLMNDYREHSGLDQILSADEDRRLK